MEQELLKLGAIKSSVYDWELDSIVGTVYVTIDDDSTHCFTTYCRFKDVNKAKLKFDCNPYSGKYNLHLSSKDVSVEDAVELSLCHLERFTLEK